MPVTCMQYACVQHACYMHGTCMLYACTMHIIFMQHACGNKHISCMLHACYVYAMKKLGVSLGLDISSVKACLHLMWIQSTAISHLNPLHTKLDQYWINPL